MLNKKLLALLISSSLVGCGGGNNDSQKDVSNEIKKPTENSQSSTNNNKPNIDEPIIDQDNTTDTTQDIVATPPTVAQIPKLTVVAEQTLSFQVIARSNIGKVLKYELSNAPSWISIDSQTGLITIEPSFSDLGNISFNIIVSDGDLSTISQAKVLVTKHNLAPVFNNPIDKFRTFTNQPFTLQLKTIDQNNDPITYDSKNLPDWLNLDINTGKISGIPGDSTYGQYDFTVNATDGEFDTSKDFHIQVVEKKELEVKSLMEEKKISLSEISNELTHPDSIAVDNNYIYIANDTSTGAIFVIDKNTGSLVKTISSLSKNGHEYTYNHVSDISIYDGKLYVASLSSNRVDIIDTSNFELINSLGTGSWSGEDKYTLVHPQAVIANDKYVFVLDKHAQIAVYQQSDIINGTFLHIPKYAYFYLGGDTINRQQQLVIKDNYLIVNDISDHLMAAYGIDNIKGNTDRSDAIQPTSLSSNVAVLAAEKYNWLTVNGSSASLSTNIDYKSGKIIFNNTYLNANIDNAGNQYSNIIDSEILNNTIYNLKKDNLFIDHVETGLAKIESDLTVPNNSVHLDSIPKENISQGLQNGTSWDILTNPELTHFKLNHLIDIKFDQQHNIIVTSYAAQDVTNVAINIKLKKTDTWFKAFTIDKIPAYGRVIIPNDKIDLKQLNTVTGGNVVDLSSFINDERYNLNAIFDNDFSSETDKLIQKLKTIKVDWDVSFGKYSKADGNWVKITPLYAREWVIMATNFAYLISSPEFKYTWFHYKDIYGEDFYGNDGPTDTANGFFTPEQYQKYYNEMIHRTYMRAGISTIGGGLGGGDVWGVDTWIFYSHYYANYSGASLGCVGHEFGHHWGSHDSSWANEARGLQRISHELNQYFVRSKEFPYTDDNINGFYKASNEERYGHGVENAFRQPLGALNTLEIYLKDHFKDSNQ
ncbi:putative Ig domain-containing protein [Photobacterium damselae]|uniref:putative Ig domain-containing protein n=1 Tax=Photobacterium damselae TaxID=38293 RepID=UPI00083B2708|nr:putative Ig domain-containing protein [Photobacterium damselae]ODA26491.1 hypothetical protein A0J46_03760 [Photobacterium damselae subsp. damselae]